MAAYATQADLENEAGGAQELIQLADHDRDGAVDAAVIAKAIEKAQGMINAAIRRWGKEVDLDPPPPLIRDWVAAEAVYWLKKGKGTRTEADLEDHQEREKWRQRLAEGKEDLGIDASAYPKSGHQATKAIPISSTRSTAREKLKGF